MKKCTNLLLYAILFLLATESLHAQTPTDAIMMKQRQFCFGLVYDHGSWDQYWEGTHLRKNETVATFTRQTVLPMISIGILDRLNLIVAAPYVWTKSSEPNGGKFMGAKGFQDISIALKGEILNKQLGSGNLTLFGTIGYSTPMTNYLSDYKPYSIGLGTNEWSYRGILQYKLDNGFYLRAMGAYLWRGQTKAERDYYYNNGSYYTAWMDVPNAWNYQVVVGKWFLENSLRVEATYNGMRSTSGDDIRKYNAAQPTNKVEFDQINISSQYYIKQLKGLGVMAYFAQMLNGRNIGKSSNIGVGITYQFQL